jgi:hypothetical protein
MVRHIKFEGFIERQFLVVARRIELLNFDVLKIRTTVVVRRAAGHIVIQKEHFLHVDVYNFFRDHINKMRI